VQGDIHPKSCFLFCGELQQLPQGHSLTPAGGDEVVTWRVHRPAPQAVKCMNTVCDLLAGPEPGIDHPKTDGSIPTGSYTLDL